MNETEKIWMNGRLVNWADARVHVGVHALHYGSGVFEGIRCYETPRGPAVFRLRDHLQRFHDYGDEDFELFWLYEPGPNGARLGHLHRSPEKKQPHPVPAKPVPPDFPG